MPQIGRVYQRAANAANVPQQRFYSLLRLAPMPRGGAAAAAVCCGSILRSEAVGVDGLRRIINVVILRDSFGILRLVVEKMRLDLCAQVGGRPAER